jgi:Flp pilus assembly protein TadD
MLPMRTIIIVFSASFLLAACAGDGTVEELDRGSLIREGDIKLAAGDATAASAFYEEALKRNPQDAQARAKLGDSKLALGQAQAAVAQYRQAVESSPSSREVLVGYGRTALKANDPDAAIDAFQRAVLVEPTPQNYASLGAAYDLKGDHKNAQTAYRQGLRLAPQNLNLRNNMGLSLALGGDIEAGVNVLQSVVIEPNATAQHRSNLALVYGLAGRENPAKRLLERDLTPAQVSRNLEIYRKMRGYNKRSLREAILVDNPDKLAQPGAQ